MRSTGLLIFFIVLSVLTGMAVPARAQDEPEQQEDTIGRTPPRLSLAEGPVSFWRPGAQDWVQAQVNTALAPGDQLYVGEEGQLELQIGGQAFVRGGADTQIGLESQEPDFLQFKVTAGSAAFDLRSLAPGRTVEVDTPGAAFTINHAGYYRLQVSQDRTVFTTRRGGRATATPASGESIPIGSNQALTIEGTEDFKISSRPAPPLDSWDNWNYGRTEQILEARSARYVSPGTYGVSDLDRYGTWRYVPTYGYVWAPAGVAVGWVPYSTGTWMNDPFYGWTWVDTAPWGWAPYHYGRWVYVQYRWYWAPGPIIVRPVYAPALVAFYGGPSVHISVGFAGPLVGWVALGWGEPLIPWWGRRGFIHRPWWGGWGGPRLVNGRHVRHGTVVRITDIHHYHHARRSHGLVVVDKKHFGHGPVKRGRFAEAAIERLRPDHKGPRFKAAPANFVPTTRRGLRPPKKSFQRDVVTRGTRHNAARSIGGSRKPLGDVTRPARRGANTWNRHPSVIQRPSPPARSVGRKEGRKASMDARTIAPKSGERLKDSPLPKRRAVPQVTSSRPAHPPAVTRRAGSNRPERVEAGTPRVRRMPARTQPSPPRVVKPRLPRSPSVSSRARAQRPDSSSTKISPTRQARTRQRSEARVESRAEKPRRQISPSAPGRRMAPAPQSPQRRPSGSDERRTFSPNRTDAPRRNAWGASENRGRRTNIGRGNRGFGHRFRQP